MPAARAALLALALVGCVTSRPVMAPDGSEGHYIECPRSIDLCMDKAQELCPMGYSVIDQGGQQGAVVQNHYNAFTHQSTATVTPTFRGNLTISCRQPGPPPQAYYPPQGYVPLAAPAPTCPRQGDVFFIDQQRALHCVPSAERDQAVNAGWVEAGR